MVAVERSPLSAVVGSVGWPRYAGVHFMDYPDKVQQTIELLKERARKIFEIVSRSPAPFIDFPDNITAPPIGPKRFADIVCRNITY